LAAEAEDRLIETRLADGPDAASNRASVLYRLGEIRSRLGETEEAERRFNEAADAYLMLGDAEFAAAAKIGLARVATANRRYREAIGIFERVIEESSGFPTFNVIEDGPADALNLWMWLLVETKQPERLYEATAVALPLLDPTGSRLMRIALARALVLRGRSAEELGYTEEAVEMYEKAIASYDRIDPPDPDTEIYLDPAITTLPALLSKLGREKDELAAWAQVVDRLRGNKSALARAAAEPVKSCETVWSEV
jgi:tetratricopeptide (TPR) repeat protein